MTKSVMPELRALRGSEIEAVSGAATYTANPQIAASVEATKKQEHADRLQKAYISSRPFEYYGYFG